MRLLIAVNENKGEESELSEHFGHCSHFAIYDTESKNLEIVKSSIDHTDKNLTPVDQISNLNVDAVFSRGMGQRAIDLFNKKKIELKTGNFKILKEVVGNIKNLQDLEDSCNH